MKLLVGTSVGIDARLVAGAPGREDKDAYEARGGYAGTGLDGRSLISAVDAAGLRGRGGAAFPTASKLRVVADARPPRYVVANGEESEPASLKDRWLLRYRPHLVLDGLWRACRAVGAERGFIVGSDPRSVDSIADALRELGQLTPPLELVPSEGGYVAGEETAVVRTVHGVPARPADKPPRPYQVGVRGRPTLVANVETLANLPSIAVSGPTVYRALGTPRSPGTVLVTISGACRRPGLYEVALGQSLGAMLDQTAGLAERPRGLLMGGFFGGILSTQSLGAPFAYDELRRRGSGLGCGAVVLLGHGECAIAATLDVMAFLARENAKQCGACIRGTAAMRDVVDALTRGEASTEDVARLSRWSQSLRGRGACALIDGAALLAGSLLREFSEDVKAHIEGPCPRCVRLLGSNAMSRTRFALNADDFAEGG